MKKSIVIGIISLFAAVVRGQQMNFWHQLQYAGGNQIWVNYNNDYFTSTDRYYSQGIALAGKFEVHDGSTFDKKLFRLPHSVKTAGFGIEHTAFTPEQIAVGWQRPLDHPYAAQFQAYAIFETVDTIRKNMLAYSIGGGIIGPAAMGKEIQIGIHNALGGVRPVGWENQIQNGLLLNAGLFLRQRLFYLGNWFTAAAEEELNLGTGRDDFRAGTKFQVQVATKNSKWLLAFYFTPSLKIVGYDATLQGSLISFRNSPVTVPSEAMNRLIFSREFCAMARAGKFTLSYMLHIDTPQFRTQLPVRWGGIKVGWNF